MAAALTSTLSISGQARNASGAPIAGVAVQLTGAAQTTQTTDSNGRYSFSGLSTGSYTVQATLLGCVFFPPLKTLNGLAQNAVQNFDGSGLTCGGLPSANLSLSGTVVGAGGSPLSGVAVVLVGPTPGVQTTGSGGTFSFTHLLPGAYVVQSALVGCSIPLANLNLTESTSLALAGSGLTCASSSSATITISGQARNAQGAPLSGVTILLTGPTATSPQATNASGNYSFAGLVPGSYLAQAVLLGCGFVPGIANLNNLVGSTNQNFDGSGLACGGTVSGRLKLSGEINDANGAPLAGVNVQLVGSTASPQTTGPNGTFTFTGLVPGSYVVKPMLTGCSFNPQQVDVDNLTDNTAVSLSGLGQSCGGAPTVNAGATTGSLTISGTVHDPSGNAIVGAELALAGAGQAVRFSDLTGSYSFQVPAGQYTVQPVGACALTPELSVLNVASNVSQNFVGTGSDCPTAVSATTVNKGPTGTVFDVTQGGTIVDTTFVHVEQRSSNADAVARLQEIGAELPTIPAQSFTIGGNQVIERQAGAIAGLFVGDDIIPGPPSYSVTGAVAVGAIVVRFESYLANPPSASALNAVLGFDRNFQPATIQNLLGPSFATTTLASPTTPSAPTPLPTTFLSPGVLENPGRLWGEIEMAASDVTNAVVYGTQNGPIFSNNGGTFITQSSYFFAFPPSATGYAGTGGNGGDPSITVGAPSLPCTNGTPRVCTPAQNFWFSQIEGSGFNPTTGNFTSNAIGLYQSTDFGQTFLPAPTPFPIDCSLSPPLVPIACAAVDQPHIVADRFNRVALSGAASDQLYLAWRNTRTLPSGRQITSLAVGCYPSSTGTWQFDVTTLAKTGQDWPRLSVGADGSLFIATEVGLPSANRFKLTVDKFSSCQKGFAPAPGFPKAITTFNAVGTIVGADRPAVTNYSIAADTSDLNGQRVFVTYANEVSAGSDDIHVSESFDQGATWPRDTTVNSVPAGNKFFPAICTTAGTAFVSWYDQRDATSSSPDLTSYYRAGAINANGALTTLPDVNVSGVDDPWCQSGFPNGLLGDPTAESRCGNDLPGGSVIPAGMCCPIGTQCSNGLSCDFRFPTSTCSSAFAQTCITIPSRNGVPKFGDYTGNACAQGRLFMGWTSSTPPAGSGFFCPAGSPSCACLAAGASGCLTAADCCGPGLCIGGICDNGLGVACLANGAVCSQTPTMGAPTCCSGNCEGGQCLPSVAIYGDSTTCTQPSCPGPSPNRIGGATVGISSTSTGPVICVDGNNFSDSGIASVTYIGVPGTSSPVTRTVSVDSSGGLQYVDTDFKNAGLQSGMCDSSQLVTVRLTDQTSHFWTTVDVPADYWCSNAPSADLNGGCHPTPTLDVAMQTTSEGPIVCVRGNQFTDTASSGKLTYSNVPGVPGVIQTTTGLNIDGNGVVSEFDDGHWVGNLAGVVPSNCGVGQSVTITVTDSTTNETATFQEPAIYWCANNGVAPTLIGDFCCSSLSVPGVQACP